METIAFVQLSDLHIGRRVLPKAALLSGYQPHDPILFEPLCNAMRTLAGTLGIDPAALPIVCTGDLTAGGTDNDFATARVLIHHRWRYREGRSPAWTGLALPAFLASIPGNHDHWESDYFQRRHNGKLQPDYLPASPATIELSTASGFKVQLFTIDSNPRPKHWVNWNLFAGGGFDQLEWDSFKRRVAGAGDIRKQPKTVRAVLCHHPFDNLRAKRSLKRLLGFAKMPKPLHSTSRDDLRRFAALPENGISAVLTGHNHVSLRKAWPALQPGAREMHEFRASAALAGKASTKNGFYFHKVVLRDDGQIYWHVEEYRYDRSGAFTCADKDVAGTRVR